MAKKVESEPRRKSCEGQRNASIRRDIAGSVGRFRLCLSPRGRAPDMFRLNLLICAALLLVAAASVALGQAVCSSDRQLKAPVEGFVVLDPPPYQGYVAGMHSQI